MDKNEIFLVFFFTNLLLDVTSLFGVFKAREDCEGCKAYILEVVRSVVYSDTRCHGHIPWVEIDMGNRSIRPFDLGNF